MLSMAEMMVALLERIASHLDSGEQRPLSSENKHTGLETLHNTTRDHDTCT